MLTMPTIFFDTLLFAQTMKEAGMSEKVANTLAEELKKFLDGSKVDVEEKISDKKNMLDQDVQKLNDKIVKSESTLEQSINHLRVEMHQEIKSVKTEIHQEFRLIRTEIKNAMLMTVISLGTIVALVEKLL